MYILLVHRFICLPSLIFPSTVPWRMNIATSLGGVTWSYNFSLIVSLLSVDLRSGANVLSDVLADLVVSLSVRYLHYYTLASHLYGLYSPYKFCYMWGIIYEIRITRTIISGDAGIWSCISSWWCLNTWTARQYIVYACGQLCQRPWSCFCLLSTSFSLRWTSFRTWLIFWPV